MEISPDSLKADHLHSCKGHNSTYLAVWFWDFFTRLRPGLFHRHHRCWFETNGGATPVLTIFSTGQLNGRIIGFHCLSVARIQFPAVVVLVF